MMTKKSKKKSKQIPKEKRSVEIESSVAIRQDGEYKNAANPIYLKMTDECLV